MNSIGDRYRVWIGWVAQIELHFETIDKAAFRTYLVWDLVAACISTAIERVAVSVERIEKPCKIFDRARLKIEIAIEQHFFELNAKHGLELSGHVITEDVQTDNIAKL